jgi:hypothetical protein
MEVFTLYFYSVFLREVGAQQKEFPERSASSAPMKNHHSKI